jgi:hypothetical protein
MPDLVTDPLTGFPTLLANVPNANISNVASGQASGNKLHDVRSGKFGAGSNTPKLGPQTPPNVDPVEWKRFTDAVRTASREFDNPKIADIQDFINAHAKNPQAVDPQEFLAAVQEQRISDLVDALDHQLRQAGSLQTGRRRMRLVTPKGYLRKILTTSTPDQIAEVAHRLESLGHDPQQVDQFLKSRVPKAQHPAIDQHKMAIQASDVWEGDLAFLSDISEDAEEEAVA